MKKHKEFIACVLTLVLSFGIWIYSSVDNRYEQLQIMKAFLSVRISANAKLEHIDLGTKKSMSTIMSSYRMNSDEVLKMENFLEDNGWEKERKEESDNNVDLYYKKNNFMYFLSSDNKRGTINEIIKQK